MVVAVHWKSVFLMKDQPLECLVYLFPIGSTLEVTPTIIRMLGLGKTTLAKKVLNHLRIEYEFCICEFGPRTGKEGSVPENFESNLRCLMNRIEGWQFQLKYLTNGVTYLLINIHIKYGYNSELINQPPFWKRNEPMTSDEHKRRVNLVIHSNHPRSKIVEQNNYLSMYKVLLVHVVNLYY